jgi:hypothetical protein
MSRVSEQIKERKKNLKKHKVNFNAIDELTRKMLEQASNAKRAMELIGEAETLIWDAQELTNYELDQPIADDYVTIKGTLDELGVDTPPELEEANTQFSNNTDDFDFEFGNMMGRLNGR